VSHSFTSLYHSFSTPLQCPAHPATAQCYCMCHRCNIQLWTVLNAGQKWGIHHRMRGKGLQRRTTDEFLWLEDIQAAVEDLGFFTIRRRSGPQFHYAEGPLCHPWGENGYSCVCGVVYRMAWDPSKSSDCQALRAPYSFPPSRSQTGKQHPAILPSYHHAMPNVQIVGNPPPARILSQIRFINVLTLNIFDDEYVDLYECHLWDLEQGSCNLLELVLRFQGFQPNFQTHVSLTGLQSKMALSLRFVFKKIHPFHVRTAFRALIGLGCVRSLVYVITLSPPGCRK
jgi:hypothetical protein